MSTAERPLGYRGSLYVLAFDHRSSFQRAIRKESSGGPEESAELAAAKLVVYAGLQRAVADGRVPGEAAAALIDDELGGGVAARAREDGTKVIVAVERSGRQVFEFEHGAAFGDKLEELEPAFAKALVRFNVEGDEAANQVQLERLRELSQWLRGTDIRFMFELLVPPTERQLASLDGDHDSFERQLRPRLMRDAIAAIQAAGIEADVWKVEGLDEDSEAAEIVAQARSGRGREEVACVVLGAGRDDDRVDEWLRVAARTPGFCGFAIGRSIWLRHLLALQEGGDPAATATGIAAAYARCVRVYEQESGS